MNSQELKYVLAENNPSVKTLVAFTALNTTFWMEDGTYLHTSVQPHLSVQEEALLLDRYIYDDKGGEIARRTLSAASISRALMPERVIIPKVIDYGSVTDFNSGANLAYWADEEVRGTNAKEHRDVLSKEDYRTIIEWIVMVQNQTLVHGISVGESYDARISALRTLIKNGYFDKSVDERELVTLSQVADVMSRFNDRNSPTQEPVFKHGDLHVANVLKKESSGLAIIDFEASAGGPDDNLKDIMKLLHIDYMLFDVTRSKEGAFLKKDERSELLDYYITNSELDGTTKLREPNYLLERVALNSLNQYVSRLTLAALQGARPSEKRIRNLMHDMTAVISEVAT